MRAAEQERVHARRDHRCEEPLGEQHHLVTGRLSALHELDEAGARRRGQVERGIDVPECPLVRAGRDRADGPDDADPAAPGGEGQGARALSLATRSGRVGVIGTVGTISSGAYQRALGNVDPALDLTAAACPGFVEFVERGQTSGDEVMLLAERLLAPVVSAGVDSLLLGCTHYPYLSRVISEVMGPGVVLVSSADETAFALAQLMRDASLGAHPARTGTHTFLSSGDVEWFADLGRRLLGPELMQAGRWSKN